MRRVLFALLLLGVASPALAYRPFDSTDADVAERGTFELELGPIGYLYSPEGHALVLSQAIANFGFADGWELVVQGRGLLSIAGGGVGGRALSIDESGVFVKHVLKKGTLQGKRGVSVAIEIGFLPPQGSGQDVGFSVDHIVSYEWRAIVAHLNVQISETPLGHYDLFGGLILEGPRDWRVRPVAELVVERESQTRTTESILGGFIARVNENLSIDLAARFARIDLGGGGRFGAEVRAGLTLSFDTHLAPVR